VRHQEQQMTLHIPQKQLSATKKGPGRFHRGGKPGNRITKDRPLRAYRALMQAWAGRRVTKAKLREEHGAYTLIGGLYELDGIKPGPHEHEHSGSSDGVYVVQRKWLGGISAQRGY
jgi:hypothetical protein